MIKDLSTSGTGGGKLSRDSRCGRRDHDECLAVAERNCTSNSLQESFVRQVAREPNDPLTCRKTFTENPEQVQLRCLGVHQGICKHEFAQKFCLSLPERSRGHNRKQLRKLRG